jgi:ABC-type uncharacterized transport system auxiliary subunit
MRLTILILLTLLLAGCGSSGPAREDIYYRLDLSAPAAKSMRQYPGTVLVTKLEGRGFSGDRAIIFRDQEKPDQVQRYTYHLWAEAPPLAIQDLLAGYLREARVAEYVVTPAQRVQADLIISGTLFRMEHLPFEKPPRVDVDMELAVVRSDRREPLLLERYQATVQAPGQQIPLAVPAFEQAIGQIFQQFLGDLEQALKKTRSDPCRPGRRAAR